MMVPGLPPWLGKPPNAMFIGLMYSPRKHTRISCRGSKIDFFMSKYDGSAVSCPSFLQVKSHFLYFFWGQIPSFVVSIHISMGIPGSENGGTYHIAYFLGLWFRGYGTNFYGQTYGLPRLHNLGSILFPLTCFAWWNVHVLYMGVSINWGIPKMVGL